MKFKAQLFSKKGFLGPPIECNVATVNDIGRILVMEIDALPDEFEDVKTIDWTRITIEIIRKDE